MVNLNYFAFLRFESLWGVSYSWWWRSKGSWHFTTIFVFFSLCILSLYCVLLFCLEVSFVLFTTKLNFFLCIKGTERNIFCCIARHMHVKPWNDIFFKKFSFIKIRISWAISPWPRNKACNFSLLLLLIIISYEILPLFSNAFKIIFWFFFFLNFFIYFWHKSLASTHAVQLE